MLRVLFFLLLAYIVLLVVRAYLAGNRRRSRAASIDKGEEMVLDPQCLSYVPKREAIFQGQNYFCSVECAKLYLSR